MSNRKLAVSWAIANLKGDNFIISDKFFAPFSPAVRKGLVRELQSLGIDVYSLGVPEAAILTRRNSTAVKTRTEFGALLANKTGDALMPVTKYLVNFPLA